MICKEARREDLVQLPSDNSILLPDILESVLDNPAQLINPDNLDGRTPAKVLLVFTRWLEKKLDDATPQNNAVPQHMTSRAVRLIFAIYSLEFRYYWPAGLPYGEYCTPVDGTPQHVRGIVNSSAALKYQKRWKEFLNNWESDSWLSEQYATNPESYESDLLWLTETWPSRHWPNPPRSLFLGSSQDQRGIADDVAERFLELGNPWQAAKSLAPKEPFLFAWTAYVAFILAGLTPVLLFLFGHSGLPFAGGFGNLARWSAAIEIIVLLAIVILVQRRYLPLIILRIPAACGVGATLLLTLTANWWVNQRSWQLGAAFLFVAGAYLALEARQHGATRVKALGRGLGLALIGTLISAVLSIAILGFVAPRIADKGECLSGWWDSSPWQAVPLSTTPGPAGADSCAKSLRASEAAAPARTLLLMTGWSLAFGLGAQILWDDRPVTAPLGRLRRTRGGTG